MVNIIRRFQQPLLIALTILTIISFVVLFNMNGTRGGHAEANTQGEIYGQKVSQTEVQRASKRFEIVRDLMLMDMQLLMGNAQTLNEAQNNYVWNSIVLRHEADELGVMSSDPSDEERKALEEQVAARIQAMPVFQNAGKFDYARYQGFVKFGLAPRGMGDSDLQEVMTDTIRIAKVKQIVGSTVAATPDEVRTAYTELNGKMEASVIRWKLEDFKAAATVTDEEVKKLFEDRKDTLKTPEKRSVKFAALTLPKSAQALLGKEKAEAMQPLATHAQAIALGMSEKGADFDALAAKAKAALADAAKSEVTIGETASFEAGQPPVELESSPMAGMSAFRLTKEDPNSDVITGQKGYYVLQLGKVEEPRSLTFDEAKEQLTEQLKQEKAQEAMNLKAAEIRTKLDTELKAGKSLDDAAKTAGVTLTKVPAFSQEEPPKEIEDAQTIVGRSMALAEGQLSDFLPSPTGGLLLHLDKKLPIDEAAFAQKKASLTGEIEESKRDSVFRDWLRVRAKAANMRLFRS